MLIIQAHRDREGTTYAITPESLKCLPPEAKPVGRIFIAHDDKYILNEKALVQVLTGMLELDEFLWDIRPDTNHP